MMKLKRKISALIRFMFFSRTYTGEIKRKTIFLDGAKIENAQISDCTLVYIGIGKITVAGHVKIEDSVFDLGSIAMRGANFVKVFEKGGE